MYNRIGSYIGNKSYYKARGNNMSFTGNFRRLQEEIDNRQKQGLPVNDLFKQKFELLQSAYREFKEKMAKSDLGNSFTRYQMELQYLSQMKEAASQAGISISDIEAKEMEIKSILERDFGYISNE